MMTTTFDGHRELVDRLDEAVRAITIHVYGRELHRCTIFEDGQSGWYQQQTRDLWYS